MLPLKKQPVNPKNYLSKPQKQVARPENKSPMKPKNKKTPVKKAAPAKKQCPRRRRTHRVELAKPPPPPTPPPYKDYSKVPRPADYVAPKRLDQMNMAQKVHHMLAQKEFVGLVMWMPHGRAFKVCEPELFEVHICEKYFGHRSYARFRHDLEQKGFKFITSGRDKGCKFCYNEFYFRRGERPKHSLTSLNSFETV